MYQEFYQLKTDPFRLSPDHAFCFRYPSFSKAKAYMQYALNSAEGFVMVTGKPGMGKTTLINDLLSDFGYADYLTATLVTTQLDANDLLRMIAYDFGLDVQNMDKATILQKLKQFLIQATQSDHLPLLIVDEAQNLAPSALEELRLLTNLQFDNRPLLQIFLVGQEGLRDKIQDVRMEQLCQRITAACHLDSLTLEQTAAYVLHRLRVAGWKGAPKLRASIFPILHRNCHGIPRRINQFCSRLLLHASLEEKAELTKADAIVVAKELDEEHLSPGGSNHDFLTEVANPDQIANQTAALAATESLLAAAENILEQQEPLAQLNESAPTPAPDPVTLPSPSDEVSNDLQGLIKEAATPPIPPVPQPVAPARTRLGASISRKAIDAENLIHRRSKWSAFAYTSVILAIIGITLFSLPKQQLVAWIPSEVLDIAKNLPLPKWDYPKPKPISNITPDDGSSADPTAIDAVAVAIPKGAEIGESDPSLDPIPGSIPRQTPSELSLAKQDVLEPAPVITAAKAKKTSSIAPLAGLGSKKESAVKPLLIREVSFGFDSTAIKPEYREMLDEVAVRLKESQKWVAHILGYTDNVGSKNYNQHLSQSRANAVAEYLTSHGVPSSRLRIEGKGPNSLGSNPKAGPVSKPSARMVQIVVEPLANNN